MTRTPAAIVIPAWNEWEATKACLESLRPTLGVRDEVIVVDNGSRDATPEGLKRYSWVKVVTNEENQGFARGCNQGAAAASPACGVVVFLNNDTLTPPHWLDGLLAPFEDETVGATGPRSNFVSGPQLDPAAAYTPGKMSELKAYAKQWRASHKGQVEETSRLVGFCLAVDKATFDALGGFDEGFGIGGYEDDDLGTRIIQSGKRLLIAHESFVHHEGHRTFDANGVDWYAIQQENQERYLAKNGRFQQGPGGLAKGLKLKGAAMGPLVSACMIVKDEEAFLPECLASLRGFADEVVVYDTGSTDTTVDIARAAGAVVIEGYWDDDFGRARNAALEHCTGRWALHIDADERLTGDIPGLRDALQRSQDIDTLLVPITNVGGENDTETSTQHFAERIFLRHRGHWVGRLHEQVVARPGQPPMRVVTEDYVELVHLGYQKEVTEARNKVDRNVRISEAELEALEADDDGDEATAHDRRAAALVNLARSLNWAGKVEEAAARFAEARAIATAPHLRTGALRAGAEVLLALGRASEALEWIKELQEFTKNGDFSRYLEAQAHLNLGDHEQALACLEGITELRTVEGVAYSASLVPLHRSMAFAAAERWAEAADALLEMTGLGEVKEAIWKPLVEAQHKAGRTLDDVAAAVAPDRVLHVAVQVMMCGAELADELAEAMWNRTPGDAQVLGFGARVAPALAVPRALEWSARLRRVQAERHCPLMKIAADPARPSDERVLAAAVAYATFTDIGARALVQEAAALVPPADFEARLMEIDQLAPALLDAFVIGAITTRDRVEAMAAVLRSLGAEEQADAILAEGVPASV